MEKTKFIFVTGGVLSSLGKGTLTASLAKLLQSCGVNVAAMKIDPYLNCDAGTLNPFEHGEVFVTRDGAECDLDLGTYERFLNTYSRREQNLMMGNVYKTVVEQERAGKFLGKTIQLIPHVTDEIKLRVHEAARATSCNVLIVEIGGTVGDIESGVVLEAVRQLKNEQPGDVLFVHIALVPTITTGEQKTKPLQHSVRALLMHGVAPTIIVARCERELTQAAREKIALFGGVRQEDVLTFPNVANIYELPLRLAQQNAHQRLGTYLGLKLRQPELSEVRQYVEAFNNASARVSIAVVGKYATTKDAYMSIFEALMHAALANGARANMTLVDSETLECKGGESKGSDLDARLSAFDGVLVPGGFGARGVEGKIAAISWAREHNKPFLGICFGFQLSVVEIARNLLGFADAHSTEIEPNTKNPVVDLLPEQRGVVVKGGTMRLGAQVVHLCEGSLAAKSYRSLEILKRHRHRYEVNPFYVKRLGEIVRFSGWSSDGYPEILELPDKNFFVATQFHPEFDSRPLAPEPLFNAFIKATLQKCGARGRVSACGVSALAAAGA